MVKSIWRPAPDRGRPASGWAGAALLLGAACVLAAACGPRAPSSSPGQAAAPDTGRVAVQGGTLFYLVRGSGPAVVLLHAGGMDHTLWDPQVGPLAREFRVIRYDARGHGRSTAPPGPYSTAEDLRLLLDHLGVQRASLVGISMGAGAAMSYSMAHPERVSRLALVSTSAPPPGVPVAPGAVPPLTVPEGRAWLRALTMPRLLVVGEGDSAAHLEVARRVEAEVPQVRVVRLAGGRHLVNLDAPRAFTDLLLQFLRQP